MIPDSSGRLEKYSIHAKNCSIYLDGINSGKIFYKSRIYEMEISAAGFIELKILQHDL